MRRSLEPSQYLAIRYTERLADAGIEPSVGSVGDSYDNAMAESLVGLYKAELVHHRGPWRNLDHVEFGTLEYVDWFNHRRLMGPIGDVPPAEFEDAYWAANGAAREAEELILEGSQDDRRGATGRSLRSQWRRLR